MTRMVVYSVALGVFVAATVMTIISILTPNWVSLTVKAQNTGATFSQQMGLHQSCSSENDPSCRAFPDVDDCRADQFFCSMWRSSGFLLSFAAIVELATAVSFVVVMAGGKFKREEGWKVVAGLLVADAVIEFAGLGIVAYLFNHDQTFNTTPGWKLDWSWILCTVSASISMAIAATLAASAYFLAPEDDYEYLEDTDDI